MNDCFATEGVSWATCIGMCTSGAADLTGDKKAFQTESCQIASNMTFVPCIIHREALASYYLESKLIVNFVKAHHLSLTYLQFSEIQSDHKSLLFHSEMRLLSRGKFCKWLVELKGEVWRFLQDSSSPPYHHLLDKKCLVLWNLLINLRCQLEFQKKEKVTQHKEYRGCGTTVIPFLA